LEVFRSLLKLAAAAAGKDRAGGRPPFRRGREDRSDPPFGVILFLPGDPDFDPFAGKGIRNENDPARIPAEPFSSLRQLLDLKCNPR
jgi:hypothetical protein